MVGTSTVVISASSPAIRIGAVSVNLLAIIGAVAICLLAAVVYCSREGGK